MKRIAIVLFTLSMILPTAFSQKIPDTAGQIRFERDNLSLRSDLHTICDVRVKKEMVRNDYLLIRLSAQILNLEIAQINITQFNATHSSLEQCAGVEDLIARIVILHDKVEELSSKERRELGKH